MIKKNPLLFILLLLSVLIYSCEKEEKDPVNEAEVLATYLESTESPLHKDYVSTDLPSIIAASEVKTLNETNQVYIIDIRTATDFATGHIKNAHNVALADILTHIKGVNLSTYTKVAIVCYTGQTAGFAAGLLRLMGYDKVFSMKWGMCAWHTNFAGKWNTAIASGNAYQAQFTATASNKNTAGSLPVLSTGKTTGQEILEARVNALLAEGFTPASVNSQTLFGNLTGYYIVNYWPAAQYADPGHINGAVQYTPKESLKLAADLKTLPTDKPVAVYCYTGQTSAFLAAYLRVLGYDAKSVLFGTNGMIYDKMVQKSMTVFKSTEIMGYSYE
ncbi:MAG TPA: rhodanese-like domain-containing protein [Bacteroidales bacterium]|nr:rhodanese-like domain-containing protein [Bacteroidales bacterium]